MPGDVHRALAHTGSAWRPVTSARSEGTVSWGGTESKKQTHKGLSGWIIHPSCRYPRSQYCVRHYFFLGPV